MKWKHIFIVIWIFSSLTVFSQENYTISGIVTDSKTGNTLDGINIVVKDKLTGTITNQNGSYLLYLNEGVYDVTFSSNKYKEEKITIVLNENHIQKVELTPVSRIFKSNPKKKRGADKPNVLKILALSTEKN